MLFSLHAALFAPLIVVVAYIVLAIGGFGSALIAIPLLALLIPVKVVIPALLLVDILATTLTGLRFRKDVDLAEMKPLIAPTLVGLIAGVTLLVKLPSHWVLSALGVFILGYGVYSLIGKPRRHPHSKWWAVPAGVSGGVCGGLFGMGGPVYVVYLAGRLREAARLRATLSAVFTINTAARLLMLLASGLLLQKEVWIAAAYLLPFMPLGLLIGHRLHVKLSAQQIVWFLSVLLILTGASVLWKALAAA